MWHPPGDHDFNRPSDHGIVPAGQNKIMAKNGRVFTFNIEQGGPYNNYISSFQQANTTVKPDGDWQKIVKK